MIGSTRNESSIRLQKQAHIKREFHEIEEDDGAYVSKPGTNACIASNHKSLYVCFFGSLQKEILAHSNKIMDKERIIELILEQQEEKIMISNPAIRRNDIEQSVKGNRQMGF